MGEGDQSGAPVAPNLVLDRRGHYRDGQYVAPAGADTWNEYAMAKYNNDYNYWLLQQQQQYNSPEEQVKRLRAAGLNPNFNSIEGAGNTNFSMATSTRGLSSNVGSLGNQQLGLMLNAFNSTLGAIAQGVDMTSKLSHLPSDIKKYREALTNSEFYKSLSSKRQYEIQNMLAAFEATLMGQQIEAPFDGWISDIGPAKMVGDIPLNYQGQIKGDEPFFVTDSPKYQMYQANLDYREKATALVNAQKALADLKYNIDKWQDSDDVRNDRIAYLDKQLEILGVDKDMRLWLYETKNVELFLKILGGVINVANAIR